MFGRVPPTREPETWTDGRDAGGLLVASGRIATSVSIDRPAGHGPRRRARIIALLAAALMTVTVAGAWAPTVLAAAPSISGTVRDTNGTPLSGITVRAGTIANGGFTGVGSSVTTAGDGSYTIPLAAT